MHIHILGICGTFMGGLAVLARATGHRVTGCDANVYPPMSTQLRAEGIDLIEGFDASQLGLNPDLWVIGNVVARGNPLMEAILDAGLPYVSGPQWIGEHVLGGRHVLAVAGTHGKTTTSSMLAWILEYAGLQPGFLIGGVPRNFGVSARLGAPTSVDASKRAYFVIEADEYDTAFFDKRSKFVHYRPRTAILNNLEYDHADIFPDLDAIEVQFHHLVRTVPGSGKLIVNGTDAALTRVLRRGVWSEVETFAEPTGWHAVIERDAVQVMHGENCLGVLEWSLQGEHNIANGLAALAAAAHVGVPAAEGLRGLKLFESVKRRMELRGAVRGVSVYDDFAHHPTAIATTVAGLRRACGPQGRILAVLEPRSNTMKLGVMKAALPHSLAEADRVYGYAPRIGKSVLGWDLSAALAPLGAKVEVHDSLPDLVNAVAAEARAGDQILVMSNGDFGGVHDALLKALELS